MSIETVNRLGDRSALPLPARRARRARLDPLPRLDGRHRRGLGLGPVAARALHQEHQAAARPDGRPDRGPLLRRPRARPGRARHHVDAGAAADDQHDGAAPGPRTHRVVLRRPGPPLHAPGLLRPPHRLAEPPARHPRQPARARHVGRRGPHPPLPHQGAGRDAADLPAVLRPLHPDGPRRQLHAGHRQAQVQPQAGRPDRRDARLPARQPAASATSSSPAATSPTCRGRGSRPSSTRCSTSTTSATSGSPPRR